MTTVKAKAHGGEVRRHPMAWMAALVLVSTQLAGCAAALLGTGVAVSTLVATDRRTSGAQLEDQTIEVKAANRLSVALKDTGHYNVTSYNRRVLMTGEVVTEQDRLIAEKIVTEIDNVKGVINELAAMPVSSITQRTNDTIVTGRLKAALLDMKISPNTFKVVTERGVVYLLGRVTNTELDMASKAAQAIPGVVKVVRVVEILTPAEQEQLKTSSNKSPS